MSPVADARETPTAPSASSATRATVSAGWFGDFSSASRLTRSLNLLFRNGAPAFPDQPLHAVLSPCAVCLQPLEHARCSKGTETNRQPAQMRADAGRSVKRRGARRPAELALSAVRGVALAALPGFATGGPDGDALGDDLPVLAAVADPDD